MKIWPGSPEIFQWFVSIFQHKSQVLEHCWSRCVSGWSKSREGNGPSDFFWFPDFQDSSGCIFNVHGQAGAGVDGNTFVLSLPVPKLNSFQTCACSPGLTSCAKEGQGEFLPKTWLLLFVPPWELRRLPSFANAVHSANTAVITTKDCWLFEAPQGSPNMFFPLSAASKAQVSQICFPCKLFLHN